MLFALSIIYGEIRRITGSVWPAVILHCITNAVQHPLDAEYLTIKPCMEYLVSFNGLFMTVIAFLFGIMLYKQGTRSFGSSKKVHTSV